MCRERSAVCGIRSIHTLPALIPSAHRLLIDIWRTMVAGAAIDEQRQQRQPIRDPAAGPSESLPGDAPEINEDIPEDDDSDEERDPNVTVVQAQIANKPVQAPEPVDILDVSDYGDSSDDSD